MIRDVVSVRDRSRIHYRRLGQGPGMVLLHGYPQTGHMWRKVMPALAERFTVVAPDLRGYGDSDRPAAGYDKRTMAADVADVIRTLGIQPVVLVGHDRGARVAHRFALDHPSLLTRLVLLDIAPTYDVFARTDQVGARARWHWFFHQLPDLPEALTAGREEIYLRYMYRTSAYNPAAIEEDAVQEYVRCFRQPGAMRAGFEDYRAARRSTSSTTAPTATRRWRCRRWCCGAKRAVADRRRPTCSASGKSGACTSRGAPCSARATSSPKSNRRP